MLVAAITQLPQEQDSNDSAHICQDQLNITVTLTFANKSSTKRQITHKVIVVAMW